ncbi:MAG: DUF5399 family protein [Parachlamydiales bacterium]|jgi:hypothetical protein
MADAKTVDNLGLEVHKRYIDDVKLLSEEEVKKIFQAPSVASRAEILKTAPQLTEMDLLWGTNQSETSLFEPPANFAVTSNIFSYQMVPSLGSMAELVEKLESIEFSNKKRKKKKKKTSNEDEEENEGSEEEEELQKQHLIKFATMMTDLNKIITEIKKRKDEYHKG